MSKSFQIIKLSRIWFSMLLFFMLAFGINAQKQSRQTALAEVAAAENSFADRAFEGGTRTAFLEFAADNAVVFNLKAENAKEVWAKRETNASLLAWRPAWVGVSAAGNLGYTTGSWAFSRSKAEHPIGWGEYFTIWKKQPDGVWKFLLDLGIQHGQAEVVANIWKSPEVPTKSSFKKDSADVWMKLEKSFSESAAKNGAIKTYKKFASDQIRLLREGNMPFQGKSNVLAQISDTPIKTTILGGEASGDMAFAYGEYEITTTERKTEKGFYARVWKRESKNWRICADVLHPLLPQQN